jgi:uncharacterized protein (TIGR02266 family)
MPTNEITLESRNNPRFLARIAIFSGPYQKDLVTDYSLNICTGGVFIETAKILPAGTELVVKFCLPNSDTVIVTKARVAWTNEPGTLKKTSLPSGMGLQFLDLSLDDMHAIRAYLDKGSFVPTW